MPKRHEYGMGKCYQNEPVQTKLHNSLYSFEFWNFVLLVLFFIVFQEIAMPWILHQKNS